MDYDVRPTPGDDSMSGLLDSLRQLVADSTGDPRPLEIAALKALVEKQSELIANQERIIEIQEQFLIKVGVSATRWRK